MQEVKDTKSVVDALEYLNEVLYIIKWLFIAAGYIINNYILFTIDKIQNCVKRFQEYLAQGRIEEASGTITYMVWNDYRCYYVLYYIFKINTYFL